MFKVSETHQAATWLLHEKVSSNVKKDVDEMTRPDDEDILEEPKKIYEEKLIKVDNLKKYFKAGQKNEVKAIDSISFDIFKGETFGLVGESGCGKSTTGRTLVNLYNPTEGEVFFKGENIKDKNKIELHKQMQMIFQDPYSSL